MSEIASSPDPLIEVVTRLLPHPPEAPLAAGTHLRDDLGLDSLDTVELCAALEEELGVEVPDAAREESQTVGDLIAQLAR